MGVVWLRSRAELRAKWRTTVVLALLLGIGGGVALTAFAGARRTDAAMSQFVTYSQPDDGGFLFGNLSAPPVTPGAPADSRALPPIARRIVALPEVAAYSRAPYLYLTTQRSGRTASDIAVIGAADPALLRRMDAPMVLAGHLPASTDPFEITVNELAAQAEHLHVGSHVHLYAYSEAQIDSGVLTGAVEKIPPPNGPTFAVRVAAIVRSPQDVSAVAPLEAQSGVMYEGDRDLYVTPAFLPRLADRLGIAVQRIGDINLVAVRLHHGASDWRQFARAAKAIGGSQVFVSSGNVYGIHSAAASAQRGIHLDVLGLVLFGTLAALVTLALVGQGVSRQVVLEGDDYATLRVLGTTRPQLMGIVTLRAGLVGIAGAVVAFVVSVLASPLMPIGIASQAEVHSGIDIDPLILLPGALVLGALIVVWATVPAWRVSRSAIAAHRAQGPTRRSRIATMLSRSPLPPGAGIGTRFALEEGGGRADVPVRTAMLGAALSVAMLGAVLTFVSSLDHLFSSPHQQGWNWDVLVGNPNDLNDRLAQDGQLLAHNRFVGSYSAIAILASQGQGDAMIDGVSVPTLLAIDPLKGSVYPPILQGHAPRADDQIVLGTQTLHRLHRQIGQSVQIATPQGPLTLHIVGRMIAPSVGDLFSNALGEGAWVYGPAVRSHQNVQAPGGSSVTPPTVFNMFAVRYARGVAPAEAYAGLRRQFGAVVLRQLPSEDVLNLQNVDRLPLILAGLVSLLGVVTIGNTLVISVRRRRRDLAILKSIGLGPRQVAGVVAWEATAFSVVALIIGIPFGIAAGTWAWGLVASSIGSVSPAQVPALAIALIVPATLIVCNLTAAVPGWMAARVPPASVMRSD